MRAKLPWAILLSFLAGCSSESEESTASRGTILFRDATSESGIAFRTTSGRTPSTEILEVKGGGLALLDFDQDGDADVFVPNGATLDAPDAGPGARLYENLGGLRFRDVTENSGLRWNRFGFGVTVADIDKDGQDDLFIAGFGMCGLFLATGKGRFEDVTEQAGIRCDGWCSAAAFGDLDGDGDLDLYVARYLHFDPKSPPAKTTFLGVDVFAGPRGLKPLGDFVYENLGNGKFRDVTEPWGFGDAKPSYGLGVVIADFDLDGKQDVFVGNDSQADFLFVRKEQGKFEEIGVKSGIGLNEDGAGQATMGIAVGDVDGNGLPDVFTTNFMNDTNTLHLNLGAHLYDDQTTRFGLGLLSRPFVGWAAGFYDFDHDRDEDLLIFNGHTYPAEIADPRGWKHAQVPLLFRREPDRFHLVTSQESGEWLSQARSDRSAAFADLDRDGDVDVLVTGLNEPVRLLENQSRTVLPGLLVELSDLRPESGNRHGLGAHLRLEGDRGSQHRWIVSGGSYQAATMAFAHFAKDPLKAERLHVVWPDGFKEDRSVEPGRKSLVIERRN